MAESDYCNKYTKQTVTSTQKNRLLTQIEKTENLYVNDKI